MYELLDGAVTVASYFPLVLFLQPYLFLLFICFYSIAQLNSDYDTIIVGASVSTVSQTISHYGGRKLSDYKFIVFAFGASDDDIRSIVTVPRIIFEKIGKSYSFVAHGSNDSTISVASFTYASDTATTIKLSADHGVKYIRVFGVK